MSETHGKPYPNHLAHTIADRAGKSYLMRPIRPEDAEAIQATVAASAPEDVRLRFFSSFKRLPDMLAERLTQIDYDRDMAFVVEDKGNPAFAGIVRLALDVDRRRGEFAVVVRTDLKGHGLGWALMHAIIAYARSVKATQIFGDVLAENDRMLKMCDKLGFRHASRGPFPGVIEVVLDL